MPLRNTFVRTLVETDGVIAPMTTLPRTAESTPIEFPITPRAGHLILPKMRIHDKIEILKVDPQGKRHKLVEDDLINLVDFAGMTRYKLIEVYINQTPIHRAHYCHGIISYLRALTEFDKHDKEHILSLAGWMPDEGSGLHSKGRMKVAHQPTIEMLTPLMADVFNHDQPFPDDVEILIKLFRAPIQWVINGAAPSPGWTYEINLLKADLLIRRLEMPRGTDIYAHAGFGGKIMFGYPAYEPWQSIVQNDVLSVNEEIINGAALPDKIICLYIDQQAYNGKYEYNPLKFDHLYTREVNLRRDDLIDIPATPYKFELAELTMADMGLEDAKVKRRRKRNAPPTTVSPVSSSSSEEVSSATTVATDGEQRHKRQNPHVLSGAVVPPPPVDTLAIYRSLQGTYKLV